MSKEIKLSDGKLAVIKDGKGLDLLNAQKKAKTSDYLVCSLCTGFRHRSCSQRHAYYGRLSAGIILHRLGRAVRTIFNRWLFLDP